MTMPPSDPTPADYGLDLVLDLAGEPLTAPPGFAALLGYPRDRRHVAFAWGMGDTIEYDDGRSSGTGTAWPWLTWSRHIAVRPSLTGIDYGSCDSPPLHRLVLDRFSSRLYVGVAERTRQFLASAADLRAERAAWEALTAEERRARQEEAGRAMQQIIQNLGDWTEEARERVGDQVAAGREMDRAAIPRLVECLDARPVLCPSCRVSSPASGFRQSSGPEACPACRAPFWGQPLFDHILELRRSQRPSQP